MSTRIATIFATDFTGDDQVVGRSERIRTSDPIVPNDVRYQAALHSDSAGRF